MANAGGAWDNAKKIVEVELKQKGTPLHDATVVGDTVGDPFKDTSSVALNPIIKFTTLFGLLAVELAVKMTAESGATFSHILARCVLCGLDRLRVAFVLRNADRYGKGSSSEGRVVVHWLNVQSPPQGGLYCPLCSEKIVEHSRPRLRDTPPKPILRSAAALGSGVCLHYLAARSLFSIAIWDIAVAVAAAVRY